MAKYIVYKKDLEIPIIFPDYIAHKDMANNTEMGDPISAGILYINTGGEINVEMGSISLNIERDLTREDIDRMLINMTGMLG